MSDFFAGRAVGVWDLNTQPGDQKIAGLTQRLREFEQLQQRALSVQVATPQIQAPLPQVTFPAPDPQAVVSIQSYVASIRDAAAGATAAIPPTQAFVEAIRAEGVALGQTDEQINARLAALSREALATGDVARALELEEAALGQESGAKQDGTQKSLRFAQAEAAASKAAGDYGGALRILSVELQRQGDRSLAVINAERQLITLDNQAAAAAERDARALERQTDATLRAQLADARALAAKKDFAGALDLSRQAQANATNASAGALAQAGVQIATYERQGDAIGALKGHLSGLISPLALATTGFGLAAAAAKSFSDALEFEGTLQEERTSFGGIIGDFQKGNAVLDEATARTRAYGFTTKETTDAFRELAPIIRESTSSTKDQSEALARISVLKPDAPVQALTSAIEGIKTGRFRELSKELGLSTAEQQQLKLSTEQGKDAFIALNEVLDRHGITLQVAAERTEGLAGAQRQQAQAQEDLQRAQAGASAGLGVELVRLETFAIRGLTLQMGSNANAAQALQAQIDQHSVAARDNAAAVDEDRRAIAQTQVVMEEQAAALARNGGAFNAYSAAVGGAGSEAQATATKIQFAAQAMDISARASVTDAAAKDAQQAKTALLSAESNKVAAAFLQMNPQIDASGVAALVAAGKLDPFIGQLINMQIEAGKAKDKLIDLNNAEAQTKLDKLITLRSSEGISSGRGGGSDAATEGQAFADSLKRQADEEKRKADEAKRQLDAQIALAKAMGDTATARRLLNQELADAKATGNIEEQARAIEAIKALDKPKPGGGGSLLSADRSLAQAGLEGAERLQARLAEVNRQLETAKLTEAQRKQLTAEKLDLEVKIGEALDKQRRASIDAQLGAVHDAQDRLKEAREAAGLERQLQSGRFSASQQETARLRLQEISLDQQKRALDIQKDQKAAGVEQAQVQQQQAQATAQQVQAQAQITPQLPIPSVAQIAALPPSPITLNLTIQLDAATGAATVINPPPGIQMGLINILNKAAVKG